MFSFVGACCMFIGGSLAVAIALEQIQGATLMPEDLEYIAKAGAWIALGCMLRTCA